VISVDSNQAYAARRKKDLHGLTVYYRHKAKTAAKKVVQAKQSGVWSLWSGCFSFREAARRGAARRGT
jgi:hypothetical protein